VDKEGGLMMFRSLVMDGVVGLGCTWIGSSRMLFHDIARILVSRRARATIQYIGTHVQ
jgi:hypothetical protein